MVTDTAQRYARRRAAVLAQLGDDVMIVPGARERLRNGDSEYAFRQDSDFLYLTGFNEPEAVLVLAPRSAAPVTLFLRERDRVRETWDGRRLGVERAPATLGVDAAYPIGELARRLPELLAAGERLHVRLGGDDAFDRLIHEAVAEARRKARRESPSGFVEPSRILHELRLRKDADEIATMRRAAAITREGHLAGMRATRPGAYEYEVQAAIEYAYARLGAQSTAYTSIVAGGDNATILHYCTNRERLDAGRLLLVDSGAELDGYASDVSRTWPIDGRFSAEARAVYEIVLRAQLAAIADVRPGAHVRTGHDTALRVLTEGLIDLGIVPGPLDAALEAKAYEPYYMHGTGHYLGLDVHDAGDYRDGTGTWRAVETGMVLTVEPGLYFARDAACDERWHGIGVRIEDDVLCTPDGPDNLTADVPKTIDALEALVGIDALVAS